MKLCFVNTEESKYVDKKLRQDWGSFCRLFLWITLGMSRFRRASSTHSSSDVALAQNTQNDYHHNNHRHCAFLVLHWQFYSRAFPPLASMKRKLAWISILRWVKIGPNFYSKAKGENEFQEDLFTLYNYTIVIISGWQSEVQFSNMKQCSE